MERIQGDRERDGERAADLDAVRRCVAGDRAAFAELVARWQDRVHGAIHRMTHDTELSRDLAQETFLRAWSGLSRFQGDSAFGTWLYSIALNQVRTEMRRRGAQKRNDPLSLDSLRGGEDRSAFDPPAEAPGAAEQLSEREHAELVRREVLRLDPEQREVVVLREFQGLGYEEIAGVLGVPIGTVRSRLHRARTELRERLRDRVL